MSEFDFIHDLRSLSDPDHALNFQDDAATLPAADVICTDTLVETVHFLGTESPQTLAHKVLAVNVSDVVAMNARATHALLNLSLPKACDSPWRAGFIQGLERACAGFGLRLLGGDTTRSPGPLVLTATVTGVLEGRPLWQRSGARLGDKVCVGGRIGRGAMGLRDMLNGRADTAMAEHFQCPRPRLDLLGSEGVGGCADVSDGLIADLAHICRASGVCAVLDLDAVPFAEPSEDWAQQVTGGDDYQLVFTLRPDMPVPPGCAVVGEVVGEGVEPHTNQPVILKGPRAAVEAAQTKTGFVHF